MNRLPFRKLIILSCAFLLHDSAFPQTKKPLSSAQQEIVPGDGFGTTFIGEKLSIYKRLQNGERFVGLGEVLGGLDKRGMGFTLNNTDTYKYGDPRLSMYTSIPFYIGIHSQEKIKKIYLPKGEWYNLYADELLQGEQELMQTVPAYQIPLYVKASGIIPMESLRQSTKDKPSDTLTIHICNGRDQNAFTYYEDDGNSFAYKTGGYCKRNIVFDPLKKQILFTPQEGSYPSGFKKLRLILHGFPEELSRINYNGRDLELTSTHIKLLDPLNELEDFYDKDYYKSLRQGEPHSVQKTILIDNSEQTITINW